MNYKYIFFDVANTLLGKPGLYPSIAKTLKEFGIKVSLDELKERHKIVSELVRFPDTTSREFYEYFNSGLLYSLGIIPKREIVTAIYQNCKDLPWEKFKDTVVLQKLKVPLGIISNWDITLESKVRKKLDLNFKYITFSSKMGAQKPSSKLFRDAFSKANVPLRKILYVGDSIKLDVEPVLKIGAGAILIDRENIFPYFENRITSLQELLEINE